MFQNTTVCSENCVDSRRICSGTTAAFSAYNACNFKKRRKWRQNSGYNCSVSIGGTCDLKNTAKWLILSGNKCSVSHFLQYFNHLKFYFYKIYIAMSVEKFCIFGCKINKDRFIIVDFIQFFVSPVKFDLTRHCSCSLS